MKRALLLWDHYKVIGPYKGFKPNHSGSIAEAWSLIGGVLVPDRHEQQLAHEDIVKFLRQERLDHRFVLHQARRRDRQDRPDDTYEVYPQKLLGETWGELERAGLTDDLRANGDRPMTPWGGLVIMAKLADACAGDVYARVTNRADAYRAIAAETYRPDNRLPPAQREDEGNIVPVLLGLIDATTIPIENLMRFRDNERDPTLRHNMLARISKHISSLRDAKSFNQVSEIQDQFQREMDLDLKRLRDELRTNKIKFAASMSVLTAVTGAFAFAASMTHGPYPSGGGRLALIAVFEIAA